MLLVYLFDFFSAIAKKEEASGQASSLLVKENTQRNVIQICYIEVK